MVRFWIPLFFTGIFGSLVDGCEYPSHLQGSISSIKGCLERYGKMDACSVPCVLDVLGWSDNQGLPDVDKAGRMASELPSGDFKKAVEAVVECIRDKGSSVRPRKQDKDCLSFAPLGLCMRRAFKQKCPIL